MNDNTPIDLAAHRAAKNKPVTRNVTHEPPAEELSLQDAIERHKVENLEMLRKARNLVENDQLEGVIIIGRQKGGKLFHTNHAFDARIIPYEDLFAVVGQLHALSNEFSDMAAAGARELLEDGTISDPWDPSFELEIEDPVS